MLKVRFYGKLADLFGSERDVQVEAPCTVSELRRQLSTSHPYAAETLRNRRIRACLSDTIVDDDHVVRPGEAIEFLAPVSGG